MDDGSVKQNEWCRAHKLKSIRYKESAASLDSLIRIAFLFRGSGKHLAMFG